MFIEGGGAVVVAQDANADQGMRVEVGYNVCFCGGTWEGRPIDDGCAGGLDLLAVWHVNLDGGRGGVRC